MSTRENLLTVMKKFIENDYLTAARIMEEVEESIDPTVRAKLLGVEK